MKCCICGPVRNCGPFLDTVFSNIEKIGALFDDYQIIVYYDKSNDNTLAKLKAYQKRNPKLCFYVNLQFVSPYRTHRLAHARNFCLNYVKNNCDINEYPFFIMMDFDDVNCKNVNPSVLQPYFKRNDWDALSFNTMPTYYDIWALSIYPYCFSYNHFKNNYAYHNIIKKYITYKLHNLKKTQLLPCISSFNGFSIYRTNKFLNTNYDGRVRNDLLPINYIKAHAKAQNSRGIVYKDYGHIKGAYEDCEHRPFHIQAIYNDNARIMITNDVLFL
jgi:hypothetical protein